MNRDVNGADETGIEAAMTGAMDGVTSIAVPDAANETAHGRAHDRAYGALVAKVARGAFLLMLAAILLSWAINVGNSGPVDQQQKLPYDRMYS